MVNSFKEDYSELYDIFYLNKNYNEELNKILDITNKVSKNKIKNILELGCGTGNYTELLLKQGYSVHGVDLSEDMLKLAEKKLTSKNFNFSLIKSNVKDFQLNKKFDAAFMLFDVINYITNDKDLNQTLSNIKNHLNKDSLFVFDFWNSEAVLKDLFKQTFTTLNHKGKEIIRLNTRDLDKEKNTIDVTSRVIVFDKEKVIKDFTEVHNLKPYSLSELKNALENNGFEMVLACPFIDSTKIPSNHDFKVFVIAKA